MSKTSIGFFNYISTQASRIMELMEQSQRGSSSQLVEFEKGFKVGWFWYIYNSYTDILIGNILLLNRNLLFKKSKLLLTRLLEF
jgi:hypothetical protein